MNVHEQLAQLVAWLDEKHPEVLREWLSEKIEGKIP